LSRLILRKAEAAGLGLVAPTVSAGDLGLYGFAFAPGIGIGGQSWIEGGFGGLTKGADSPTTGKLTVLGKGLRPALEQLGYVES
jgi:hypothetical protein